MKNPLMPDKDRVRELSYELPINIHEEIALTINGFAWNWGVQQIELIEDIEGFLIYHYRIENRPDADPEIWVVGGALPRTYIDREDTTIPDVIRTYIYMAGGWIEGWEDLPFFGLGPHYRKLKRDKLNRARFCRSILNRLEGSFGSLLPERDELRSHFLAIQKRFRLEENAQPFAIEDNVVTT